MSDRPSEKEYRRAEAAGYAARRVGKPSGVCPYRGSTTRVQVLAEAWRNGHDRAAEAIKAEMGRGAVPA